MGQDRLRFGELTQCVHLCVDMQRMFCDMKEWHTPWLSKVLPAIVRLAEASPENTVFTRFIPLAEPEQGSGTWQRYYRHWHMMTLKHLPPEMTELVAPLAGMAPPATVVDKHVYSPWPETNLHQLLQARGVNTLIISGGETDICVSATVTGAVDLGYRVILPVEGLCSSSDETHDAIMRIYRERYSLQIELAPMDEIIEQWRVGD